MKSISKFAVAASIGLALAFTFSCSSDDGDGGGSTFVDRRDNTTYKAVKMGSQTWMAENLNYNANGSKCGNQSIDLLTENAADCEEYGRLYNWPTAKTACPSGWHLPSKEEWEIMTAYIGGADTEGKKLKAKNGWNGTDEYGFSALPGGWGENPDGLHDTHSGFWWTASEYSSDRAYVRAMSSSDGAFWYNSENSESRRLISVRCVQD